jgi:hypothetical protein
MIIIYKICTPSDILIYSSEKVRLVGEKIGTAVNVACQGNLLACQFWHACHRFVSPTVQTYVNHDGWFRPEMLQIMTSMKHLPTVAVMCKPLPDSLLINTHPSSFVSVSTGAVAGFESCPMPDTELFVRDIFVFNALCLGSPRYLAFL